jgi:hypothetical protein
VQREHRSIDQGANAFGHDSGLAAIGVRQKDAELLVSDAPHQIVLAHTLLYLAGDHAQRFVAGHVTKPIVHMAIDEERHSYTKQRPADGHASKPPPCPFSAVRGGC